MKKTFPILFYALIFLFFIQAAGTLVESIYILDLMHLNLDTKVLGLFFFFTPLLLIPFYKKFRLPLVWITFALLLLARSLLPYLNTASRLVASGIATGAALSLFFLMLNAQPRRSSWANTGLWASAGLALAVSLSVLLRTIYYGLDYSLTPSGGWTGILLGLLLAGLLFQLEPGSEPGKAKKTGGVTPAILGVFLVLTLIYFAFSAPAVIARWTEANYTLIVLAVSLLAAGWILLALFCPQFFQRIRPSILLAWNLAFTACLTGTILWHSVSFPATSTSAPIAVGAPTAWQAIPLVLMLLLFPVLFFDLGIFLDRLKQAAPTPPDLVPGILLGGLALVLLVFAQIFTNVWGYVQPVSLFFRGKFWLVYLLPAGILSLLLWNVKKTSPKADKESAGHFPWTWALLLGAIFLGTLVRALPVKRVQSDSNDKAFLTVMTYN
ncbi:MAG: hypothetical protein WCE68_00705, partial [Anaerolineales bacterium]